MKKLFLLTLVMMGFSSILFAQTSATADAAATIIEPISIAKVTDLNFGDVAVGAGGGTVVMLATDASRTVTGDCSLPGTGTITRASFTVTGVDAETYAITLPVGVTTIDDNAGHTMTVDTWTSSPTPTGVLDQTLYVAGTLHVNGTQFQGVYNADTDFTVTVAYN